MRLQNSVVVRFNTGEKPSAVSTNSSCLLQSVTLMDHWKATEITVYPLHSRIPKTTFITGVPRWMLGFFFTSFVVYCIMFKNWKEGGIYTPA